jgi:hypothetical protein
MARRYVLAGLIVLLVVLAGLVRPTAPGVEANGATTIVQISAPPVAVPGVAVTIRARVLDTSGQPIPEATVVFVATAGLFSPIAVNTSSDGIAATTWTAPADFTTAQLLAAARGVAATTVVRAVPAAAIGTANLPPLPFNARR